ncbi:MAG: dihydropteroate synthase [Desulfobulbaceae bacterium]|nr:dihydropteroate synthase [Desulfobulbaceae bacterium]
MAVDTAPEIMGILNITPDSFSDGGLLMDDEMITMQISRMLDAGVDIFDVGGESTRPFAEPVSEQEELARVIPVIGRIRRMTDLPISIDTTKAAVAEKALAAGATMVNDISALRYDPDMVRVAREYNGPLVIMHMQGTPDTMQIDPHYDDVIAEIMDFFRQRIDWLAANGIARERIIVDPGIGFGKTVEHNLTIVRNIARFQETGCPVLIGHSRKAFIGRILDLEVDRRDCATAMLSLYCAMAGADILRVHDVPLTRQARQLASALHHCTG